MNNYLNLFISATSHTASKLFNTSSLLLKLVGLAILFGASINEANSQQYSFKPSDFTIMDNFYPATRYDSIPISTGSGYDDIWQYRLTDTFLGNGATMLYNQQVDLKKEWTLSFKLRFGTGKQEGLGAFQYGPGIGIALMLAPTIGSKFHYAAHSTSGNAIGLLSFDSNMFICEYNTDVSEFVIGSENQITSFIKNSSYTPLLGTRAQMQDNWGIVTTNTWICCQVAWKRSGNGYVFENWIEEQGSGMPLTPRNSKYFASIDDFVGGVPINSKGEALVHWAFGAIACSSNNHNPNRHEIQYIYMENAENIDFNKFIKNQKIIKK